MTDQIDICNRALAMAGTRSQITDLVSTPEGIYCGLLYDEFRDFLLREGDYDFSFAVEGLTPAPGGVPVPYSYWYILPDSYVRIRSLIPVSLNDLDPQPMSWSIVGGNLATNFAATTANYTINSVGEGMWDSIFTEAMVRMLASGLVFALENRMEANNALLQQALQFAAFGNARDP